jgi:glyoxylase-like metal-dependent hydrolase (beta-lactamase superfamily II)
MVRRRGGGIEAPLPGELPLIIESFPVGAFHCNCVILGDEERREAIVVDPGDEIERIAEVLDHYRLTLKHTVHTHGHLDHIGAAGLLRQQRGSRACIHAADLPLWKAYPEQAAMFGLPVIELPEPDLLIAEGDHIEAGAIRLEVMETPGHTPGSLCFRLAEGGAAASGGPVLFSGDTLFWKGIGRTDLWGGDYLTLMASLRERLFTLPVETVVHPGLGPLTSIGDERRSNPFLADIVRSGRET